MHVLHACDNSAHAHYNIMLSTCNCSNHHEMDEKSLIVPAKEIPPANIAGTATYDARESRASPDKP